VNTLMHDAVIVGGGMSGLMAAIYLADRGYKTALISRGDPACCLSTGCIDVLSSPANPLDALAHLPPAHPYHLVGKKGIEDAVRMFKEIMGSGTNPYVGSVRKNREILTPIGTFKTTCIVPGTMAAAQGCKEDYVHVVSFTGIKDFYPSYITSKLSNTGVSLFDAGVSSPIALAARFEEPGFAEAFAEWIAGLELPPGKVAVPAVLGMDNPMKILGEISTHIAREVFEIPTLPPSVPGLRLFRALKNTFVGLGGDVFWGMPVSSVERHGGTIEAVTLATSGRSTRVQGRAFILATGSFVSGGLFATRETVRETVFGIPVSVPGARKDWFWGDFFTAGHPIEKAGIEVDSSMRPKPSALDNLFVCGSILAGSEVMKYHCGHGLALATGLKAAKMCEKVLL